MLLLIENSRDFRAKSPLFQNSSNALLVSHLHGIQFLSVTDDANSKKEHSGKVSKTLLFYSMNSQLWNISFLLIFHLREIKMMKYNEYKLIIFLDRKH